LDASLSHDTLPTNIRTAGLGVFIVNTLLQPAQTIYVKATFLAATSVLMAEVAALALAAVITEKLGLQQVTFLSDNQQLVNFLNHQDETNPPEWRIKCYTQIFCNSTAPRNTATRRIQRSQNQTTDLLGKQGLNESRMSHSLDFTCTCTSAAHDQCLLLEALSSVTLNSIWLLTASYC
jgi:ribonuclease HI